VYQTCLFCHSALGANESIEHFPVGRRLAFDAAKGRLWVVCRKCERWNLTPLEERWEAIDECERAYSGTRLRASTDNIGLARLRDGLELVRIGKPMRPEFAAWRYGDQFGRRGTRAVIVSGSVMAVGLGFVFAGPYLGGGLGFLASGAQFAQMLGQFYARRRTRARINVPGQTRQIAISRHDLKRIAVATDGQRWALQIRGKRNQPPEALLQGDAAVRAAAAILPVMNFYGGGKKQVKEAITLIEQYPDVDRLFLSMTRQSWEIDPVQNRWIRKDNANQNAGVTLNNLGNPAMLALEMASHEEIERRALEGELTELELAWRQADEIAGIADSLTLPDDMHEKGEKPPADEPRSID
jgi:hypothetical protein